MEWQILKKLNNTNALAMNLPDNSEPTHRLERYSILTVSGRLGHEQTTHVYMSHAIGHNSFRSLYLLITHADLQIMYNTCG